jgi:hypothetical protein
MPKFMSAETALQRLVEDEKAPVSARCEALRQLAHPPLCLLRRLLVDSDKRLTPVPSRLKSIAALAYARELALRKLKPRKQKPVGITNSLGIV